MATKTRTTRGGRRTRKAPPRTGTKSPTSISPSSRPSHEERATLSAHEVAELLGVNPKTVYEAASRGQIPSRRLGRRVLFPRAAIEAWLCGSTTDRGMMTTPTCVARNQVTR